MKTIFYLGLGLTLLGPTVWWLVNAPWQTAVAYSVVGVLVGSLGDPRDTQREHEDDSPKKKRMLGPN